MLIAPSIKQMVTTLQNVSAFTVDQANRASLRPLLPQRPLHCSSRMQTLPNTTPMALRSLPPALSLPICDLLSIRVHPSTWLLPLLWLQICIQYQHDKFVNGLAFLFERKTGNKIITATIHHGLLTFQASQLAYAHLAEGAANLMGWHLRLGPLDVRDVMRLSKDGRIDGLGHVSGDDIHNFECSSGILGKGRRLPSPPVEERAQQPQAVVHVDLWGPASTASHGGCKYFLTCYDDNTRKYICHSSNTNPTRCRLCKPTSRKSRHN